MGWGGITVLWMAPLCVMKRVVDQLSWRPKERWERDGARAEGPKVMMRVIGRVLALYEVRDVR